MFLGEAYGLAGQLHTGRDQARQAVAHGPALRRLESLLVVADRAQTLMMSGQGDVIEPSDVLCAIGSGGPYALAAARALLRHTPLAPAELCREALQTAGEICVYSNLEITVTDLQGE